MNNYNYTYQNNGMNWVSGENGANAYQVLPNQVAVLFDSTREVFYIKSADMYGRPTMETYDYVKHVDQTEEKPDMSQYVTRNELNMLLKELKNK